MSTNNVLSNVFRIGFVSSVIAARGTVKVTCPDKDNWESDELPVIVRGSAGTKDFWIPEVNEQVLCAFLPNSGTSQGFCLGSFYSDRDKPPTGSADVRCVKFSDGTLIEYDKGSHSLTINCVGAVTINGKTINLN